MASPGARGAAYMLVAAFVLLILLSEHVLTVPELEESDDEEREWTSEDEEWQLPLRGIREQEREMQWERDTEIREREWEWQREREEDSEVEESSVYSTDEEDCEAKTKILLFGRTGSGKSTIANMLFNGRLDPPLKFGTSSGVRGKTEVMQREETETMVVVDTIGFCEAEGGTVTNEVAKLRLHDFFVQTSDVEYNYFAYVHKWGKTDYVDNDLWKFFKEAFKGVEHNHIIIFTHCQQPKHLIENREHIEEDFPGGWRYVSVDFPEINPNDRASISNRKDSRRNKSFELLQEEFMKSMPRAKKASIRTTLSKGRLLLIGRYAKAIDIVARVLVDGPDTTTESTCYVNQPPLTFEGTECIGRGWSVVKTVAFESYKQRFSKKDVVESAKLIAQDIVEAVQHGSFSHFIYIEGGGPISKVDKLVWKILKGLLEKVIDHVVALIVNTKWPIVNTHPRSTNLDQNTKVARKLRTRFQGCRNFLYLDIPAPCFGDVTSDVLKKKVAGRKHSLDDLEEALCRSVAHVQITLDNDDKGVILGYLYSLFEPIADAVKHPRIQWWKELDPLSKLSKMLRKMSSPSNKDMAIALPSCQDSADVCTSKTDEVYTTQFVLGSSNMSHIYLEMTISQAPLQSIHVEVDSHDQGWSDWDDDKGTYNNSWTWGELSIMDHSREFKEKKNVPRLRVYTNLHACRDWQPHERDICLTTPEDQHFLDSIENGDKLILWLRSQYPGWANFSCRGLIRVTRAT